MKEVTKLMIKKYALLRLKYDFMGYPFEQSRQLSFHHLIVPHRLCKEQGLGEGYYEWNGAILRQKTSHDYLHLIERYDHDMFLDLTSEMIDENLKGYIDITNLKSIDDILNNFERNYCHITNGKGRPLIKPEYLQRMQKR